MGQRPIVVFVKDPGGTNAVLPIRDTLQAAEYEAIGSEDTDEIFRMIQEIYPAAIITSMCLRGGSGQDMVEKFRGQCTTIAFKTSMMVV